MLKIIKIKINIRNCNTCNIYNLNKIIENLNSFFSATQIASQMIQNDLNVINLWPNRCKIKMNKTKSTHITFKMIILRLPIDYIKQ